VSGTLYLGTSGFAYDEWRGPFYPADIKPPKMLSYYATRFNSVEINYTYRRQPTERTLTTWQGATPESFRFTLKAHQRITHWLRLAEADAAVADFIERAKGLGSKLGVVLFQCPPTLAFDRGLLEAFLSYLPPTFRYAFEFRHPSWEAAKEILASQHAAWCVAETDEQEAPTELTAEPFAYLRLRKTDYTAEELGARAAGIAKVLADGRDVYCYFKHEERGAGPLFAERLRRLIPSTGQDAIDSPMSTPSLETAPERAVRDESDLSA
jgi:uncharacterized protein YecE (DUF72 family)